VGLATVKLFMDKNSYFWLICHQFSSFLQAKTKHVGSLINTIYILRVPQEFTLVEIPLAAEQETGLRVMSR
jgi:hypothetical protein